jgi:hypothetical protein
MRLLERDKTFTQPIVWLTTLFVIARPGTEVSWQTNRHVWFQADYGIFYAGRFLK